MDKVKYTLIFLFILLVTGAVLVILGFRPKVSLDNVISGEGIYKFLLADTIEEQVKGLSEMGSLPENTVMFFAYEKDDSCAIWMKDMLFNIDVVWLDKDFKVIDYKEAISPDTFPENFAPKTPCRYFIEANEGFIQVNNIKQDQRIFVNFDDLTLRLK